MADAVTVEEVEQNSKHDATLQALLEDIKKGTLRKEDRLAKYRDWFAKLSTATGVMMRVEKLVLPTSLIPYVLEAAHEGHPGMNGT